MINLLILMALVSGAAMIFPIAPSYDNPTITTADCDWIVMQWDDPQVEPYPGPATAWVHDGDFLIRYVPLELIRDCPACVWAGYIGDDHAATVIEAGWVETESGTVFITNTPHPIACQRVFIPLVEK